MKVPRGWKIGEVTAVAVDRQDHVWVLHRPRTVETGAASAPPVMEFDAAGRFVQGFGGPSKDYEWPQIEHSIAVDAMGRVWIGGNYRADPTQGDDMLLAFDRRGHFIRQIGRRGASKGDADIANVHAPADIFVDDRAHEVYVADGYVNHRVIVFDSETGAFKRMWGAFGAAPAATLAPSPTRQGAPEAAEAQGAKNFEGVHGVVKSSDGLIYVSDRSNQRIQVFTPAGQYLRQAFVDRGMPSQATASGLAFSPDARQRYLYVADWGNSLLLCLDRQTLAPLDVIGDKGTAPGQFLGPHLIATDSHGALYVAEVQGRRLQRLVPIR